jgi:superoxide reductase
MAKQNQIYKCSICGNVVDVVEAHVGELVCCGQAMNEEELKYTENEGNEKHVPVIEETEIGVIVRVGSIAHPMTTEHSIEFIEIWKDNKPLERVYLQPGEEPIAEFFMAETQGISARAYCNLHGWWRSK